MCVCRVQYRSVLVYVDVCASMCVCGMHVCMLLDNVSTCDCH